MPGKVLFSSSARIDRVSDLKAAERLFLLLKQDSPVQLSARTSTAKAASVLQSRLLGDGARWTSAVLTWSRLQRELAHRGTTVNTSSAAQSVVSKREEGRGSEEQTEEEEEEGRCNVETGKSAEGQREEEESGTGRQRSGDGKDAHTLERKRKRAAVQRGYEMSAEGCGGEAAQVLEKKMKRDNEEESTREKNVERQKTQGKREDEDDEEEKRIVMELSQPNGKKGTRSETGLQSRGTGKDLDVKSSSRKIDDMAEDCAVEKVEHVKTSGGEDKKLRIKPGFASSVPVSFRISCKCTGALSRLLSTQEVSRVIGVGLGRLLGWKADLKNPQLEVNVHLSDDHCLLGIPLTRLPLANRSYIKTTGLRSTVAWAMASLAQIQPGFCVVDPMCGVGTILIEAAQEHKAACFLGVDIDDGQLQRANDNIEFAELGNRIHLLKASSMVLPLPSASVDAVICDLPFGRKFGTKTNMAANLPVIVAEMERVLRVGGALVVLLSPQLSCLLKKLLAQKDPGPTSDQETSLHTGAPGCPSLSLAPKEQHTFQIHRGVESSPTRETVTETGPQLSLSPPPLSSLKHQTTLRVSLGAIDGLIHKYVKI
ncbi:THUMP domain-containing protein 2 isoform X2 [Scophthalmus maximus]|nr:THUMP domain-containing protein 2 isoform X2 [Scophthalmus maximus]XP_035462356.2 THUMP domain-containing protein 2 isoform X2 [Scophthalmus maximus]